MHTMHDTQQKVGTIGESQKQCLLTFGGLHSLTSHASNVVMRMPAFHELIYYSTMVITQCTKFAKLPQTA